MLKFAIDVTCFKLFYLFRGMKIQGIKPDFNTFQMILYKSITTMNTNNHEYKYFKPDEFAKCIPACCINDLKPLLLKMLDEAREKAFVPFIINSAYRSKEYEISKGRTGTSSHCKGLAVDIECYDSIDRFLMIKALIDVGFRRIGIYETFIHVDIDDTKPNCIWYGK